MLTAIVITFAVSAFLLALIYRSWQLGEADTAWSTTKTICRCASVRKRPRIALDVEEVDAETEDEETTDFTDGEVSPLTAAYELPRDGEVRP